MKKLLTFLILTAAVPALAQSAFPPQGETAVAYSVAEDGDTAVTCKYIGTAECGSIAVAAGGDATFTDGPCGAEVATDTFECPVSGALGGVIDVSDAACNTIGEFVDIVNAAADWRCLPANALRADSSNDTLVTISATAATGATGLKLAFDTSVAKFTNVTIAPTGWDGYDALSLGPQSTAFNQKPWEGRQSAITSLYTLSTYATGASTWSVLAVDRTFAAAGSETSTTIWPATANGASTVAKVFGSCDTPATGCDPVWGAGPGGRGLICPRDRQCIVRSVNADAMSVNTTAVNGAFRIGGVQ